MMEDFSPELLKASSSDVGASYQVVTSGQAQFMVAQGRGTDSSNIEVDILSIYNLKMQANNSRQKEAIMKCL
jgi:hypothetical protein